MENLKTKIESVYEIIINKNQVIESVTLNHIVQSNDIEIDTSCGYTIFMVKHTNIILAIDKVKHFLGVK